MCHIFDKNYKLPKKLNFDLVGFDSAMKEIEMNIDRINRYGKEVADICARRIINGETNFGIENIAKDIVERKDNAMAREFTKVIGELLRKNGVSVKITEYQTENHATNKFEMLYGCSIDGLDFSKHDKVLEDKISSLEKQIKKYEAERKELRTRCCMDSAREKFDNHSYGGLVIYTKNFTSECEKRLYDETQELKQHIAELESGKTSELPFNPLECANYLINATYERETSSLERAFAKVPDKVNYDRYTIDELEQIAEHLLIYCKHNKETE